MPLRTSETANKIGLKERLPHLQDEAGGTYRTVTQEIEQSESNPLVSYFLTGEAFSAGEFASIIEGVAYKAKDTVADGRPAMYIITESASSNETKPFSKLLDVGIDGSGFTDGDILWLTAGSPNYTKTKPSYSSGKIIQRLGFYLDEKIYPQIQEPGAINL